MERSGAFVQILISVLLVASFSTCGGGSGDSSSMALSGTWVSACFQMDSGYAWEKYVFHGHTGQLEGMLEVFPTSDCSGPGVIQSSGSGTYSTGAEVDCASGSNGRCTQLDLSFEGESTKYVLYSVFAGQDPHHLFMSSSSTDPAGRPDDVVLEVHHELTNLPIPGSTGEAVIGLTVIDGGFSPSAPTPPAGYTLLDIDLNGGTLGTYVWLYYRMGRADGLEGTPIGRIYTVHESDGETPLSASDIKVDVNLNGATAASNFLWLYYSRATAAPVVRCVVVANESHDVEKYGPPSAQGTYDIVWVEELDPGVLKTPSEFPQPPDAQDLNEGFLGDWIFLGYALD